jgi:hypothetical protein
VAEAVVAEPVEPEPGPVVTESAPEPQPAVEPVAEPVLEAVAPVAAEPVAETVETLEPVVAEPEPRLLLGDIGESLARELGFDLQPEPEPAGAWEPAPWEAAPVEPAPVEPAPVEQAPPTAPAPGAPAPSPYGGPMPGMTAAAPAPGAFAGFDLPPSPFLMLRKDPAQPTTEPGADQS